MRMQTNPTVDALVACIALGLQPASAQWVVNDPSTTARNTVTAVLKSSLLQTLNLERERLRRMAADSARSRISASTRHEIPRWRTHDWDTEDFLYAAGYTRGLKFGDQRVRVFRVA